MISDPLSVRYLITLGNNGFSRALSTAVILKDENPEDISVVPATR